jgi:hypothetical protein
MYHSITCRTAKEYGREQGEPTEQTLPAELSTVLHYQLIVQIKRIF